MFERRLVSLVMACLLSTAAVPPEWFGAVPLASFGAGRGDPTGSRCCAEKACCAGGSGCASGACPSRGDAAVTGTTSTDVGPSLDTACGGMQPVVPPESLEPALAPERPRTPRFHASDRIAALAPAAVRPSTDHPLEPPPRA